MPNTKSAVRRVRRVKNKLRLIELEKANIKCNKTNGFVAKVWR